MTKEEYEKKLAELIGVLLRFHSFDIPADVAAAAVSAGGAPIPIRVTQRGEPHPDGRPGDILRVDVDVDDLAGYLAEMTYRYFEHQKEKGTCAVCGVDG